MSCNDWILDVGCPGAGVLTPHQAASSGCAMSREKLSCGLPATDPGGSGGICPEGASRQCAQCLLRRPSLRQLQRAGQTWGLKDKRLKMEDFPF